MKSKIKAQLNFKTSIIDNPFELLKAIEEHSTSYQENRYNMLSILNSLRTLLMTKQEDGKSLQDYTKRFKIAKKVLESYTESPIIVTKILTTIAIKLRI